MYGARAASYHCQPGEPLRVARPNVPIPLTGTNRIPGPLRRLRVATDATINVLLKAPKSLHALARIYGAANNMNLDAVYTAALRAFLVGRTDTKVKAKATAGPVTASDEIKGEVDRLVALSREIAAEGRPKK
jgi:hypothetical protein